MPFNKLLETAELYAIRVAAQRRPHTWFCLRPPDTSLLSTRSALFPDRLVAVSRYLSRLENDGESQKKARLEMRAGLGAVLPGHRPG